MPVLKVEHFACNVSDPAGMAAWYVKHSGMRILRRNAAPPHIGDELVEPRAAILRAAHAVVDVLDEPQPPAWAYWRS
jgi:hypothetical protein